ncbi:glycosyltransferase family 39 protein [Saccharophagus degradans]|uniref:Glycosyltransferase using lipid monophospho-sugars as glycosyl donors n=1 Tax=Saccharophagus degradans (strain 2-40 / ATCC 43961 / DSM 17024) TaxID=203122 RepID=Q21JU9_SACD2|nr:glycosyltransferase family 39 protein [Saccharophagus degradans]ABD81030.1 glycosyltransferase using lipid monophospho-sugars as glycosyl donors [Saccharophagus degradans 2-40]
MTNNSALSITTIRTSLCAAWQNYQALIASARIAQPVGFSKAHSLVAGLAVVLFTIAAIVYFTNGHHAGFLAINNWGRFLPSFVLQLITVWGDGVFVLCLALLFLPRNIQAHWGIFLAAIIGGIVSNVSKDYFDALRPPAVFTTDLFNLVGKGYTNHSFPSGHSLTAFLAATLFFHYLNSVKMRWLFFVAAACAALSRVLVGVHWPVDTLVGSGLGILCALAGIYIANKTPRAINKYSHGFILFLLVTACVLLLVEKNDYRLTLPVLYVASIVTLWRTFKHYIACPGAKALAANNIKLSNTSASVWFYSLLGLLTVYRLAVIFQPHLGLFYDEAYYYHWALNPDFGYYSKPPMVAWAIIISTSILGDSIFAVKSMAAILYAGAAIFIYKTAQKLVDSWAGLIAGIIFLCIPMVGFNSVFITTDAPMFFFWSAALYVFFIALETNKLSHWVLLGLATGAGMLSKYTMGALPLGLFLFLLFNANTRPRLLTAGPWAAAIVAGCVFGLNIYWNMTNGWVALHHTQEISQASENTVSFSSLFVFLATQLLIFGPVWSYLGLRLWLGKASTTAVIKTEYWQALVFTTFTILVAISLQAFISRAFANWAGPWMIGGSLLVAVLCRANQLQYQAGSGNALSKTWLARGAVAHLLLLSAFFHFPQMLNALDITPSKKNDPYHRVAGWNELGAQLKPILAQYPSAKLASESRDILAYLGYYAAPGSFEFARWNPNQNNIRDYYDLKVNLREWQGPAFSNQQFIFATRAPLPQETANSFNKVTKLTEINAAPYADMPMKVYVYLLVGFNGYPASAQSEVDDAN